MNFFSPHFSQYGLRSFFTPQKTSLSILSLMALVVLTLCLAPKPWQIPSDGNEISHYASIYSWWAGAFSLLPLLLVAATPRWWLQTLPRGFVALTPPLLPAGFRAAVVGAMLVCAILGAVRLNDSLWHDEEFSVRRAILGTYRVSDGNVVKLRELPWSHTFWYYTKPTNHIFQSITSRLSLSAWRMIARPIGLQINEIAVRAPSYLAGILSIGAIALLLARAGLPWAGALSAWLLALHPWHLKLAPEARGYAFIFLFIPLICLFAIQAQDTGRWRWWMALALTELLLLLTWPPALIPVVVLNLCLAVRILCDPRLKEVQSVLAGRWLTSGILAGILLFQLLLPCLPQFQTYAKVSPGFVLHDIWFKNVGSLMLFGAYWSKSGLTASSPYWEMLPQAVTNPGLVPVAIFGAVLFLVIGTNTVWQTPPHGRWLTMFFLLPGPLLFGISYSRGQYMFEWYLVFMLPGLVALVAAGILQTGNFLSHLLSLRPKPIIALGVSVTAFGLLTWNNRIFLLKGSTQQYRESVLLTRPHLDPNAPENLSILTAATMLMPDVYDPRIRKVKTIDDYATIMKEAEDRNLPLYINNGFPDVLKSLNPDIDALLSDPEVFDLVARLVANEPLLDRTVHRYRPGSIKTADFSRYGPPKKEADGGNAPGDGT